MNYNWHWGILGQEPYLGWLVAGAKVSLALVALTWAIAFALGSLVGVMATVRLRPARLACRAYVELFRNVPPIVQLFMWFFVAPELLPAEWGHYVKRDLPDAEFWTAVLGLALFMSARLAEHIRAGIEGIPRTLVQAALATGLTTVQSYRWIRLPIAYRQLVPTLTSEFLICFKMSAVALTIGVLEMTGRSHQVESATFQGIEAFTVATLFYLVVSMVVVLAATAGERTLRIP